MPTELYILLVYCLCVVLMLVAQSALSVKEHGLRPLVGSRDGLKYTGVADRSIRAFNNTLISLVLIIPPVFTLALLSVSTSINTSVFTVIRCGESIVLRNISAWVFLDKKLPLVDRSFVHRLYVRDLLKPVANS